MAGLCQRFAWRALCGEVSGKRRVGGGYALELTLALIPGGVDELAVVGWTSCERSRPVAKVGLGVVVGLGGGGGEGEGEDSGPGRKKVSKSWKKTSEANEM